MQEDAENINPGVDQVTDSSPVNDQATADVTNTTDSTVTEENQTPEIDLAAELEQYKKRATDFEGMGKKWQNIAKDLKAQLKAQEEAARAYTQPVEEMDDWTRIESIMDQKLSRLMGVVDEQEQNSVINEFADMPFTKELGPEIKTELDAIESDNVLKSLPFKKRMELARNNAIAKNAHIIAEISEGRGFEKAYSHQTVKERAGSGSTERSNATVIQGQDDILSRIGSMSREEYIENYAAIEEAHRRSVGLS